jgi:hypothetical protein
MNLYRSKEGVEESKKKGTRKKEEDEIFTKAIGSGWQLTSSTNAYQPSSVKALTRRSATVR